MNFKKSWEQFKEYLSKFWFIVWKDDSLRGWVFSLLFIIIFIKLIFFPILNFVTGTTLPLAIVESCSMYHDGNLFSSFDNWWTIDNSKYEQFNINKTEFSNFDFNQGFTKGDILFIIGTKPEKLKVGDIIIFNAEQQNPIIHRIMKITINSEGERIFSTMGDNNNGQLSVEKEIHEDQIIGKAEFRLLPYVGWAKLVFFEYKQPPYNKGFC